MGMGADAAEAQVRQLEHGQDRLGRLLGGHAEPLEPDVDLDEDLARPVRRA